MSKKKTPAKKARQKALPAKAGSPAQPARPSRQPDRAPQVDKVLLDIVGIVEEGRRLAARSVNTAMTATYWAVGRRIVTEEQAGRRRAAYGKGLIDKLAERLIERCGRGFGARNLLLMRSFYLAYPQIPQTGSAELPKKQSATKRPILPQSSTIEISLTTSAELGSGRDTSTKPLLRQFVLPWSHYARLTSVANSMAREFYEAEALRGGWTRRQLARQIDSQAYERTALSKQKAAMLRQGQRKLAQDALTAEDEIKEPYILEFLDLKDEYSETDLESAMIARLEEFLLELGGDFAFVGRQRRLRVGNAWYRVDLLFFHRRLRCLVIIDIKLGRFTHADAGQMHLYVNYAKEHWTHEHENPPVGLILCAEKDNAVAKYALGGLPNKVLAAEYRTKLPNERLLAAQIQEARQRLQDPERAR